MDLQLNWVLPVRKLIFLGIIVVLAGAALFSYIEITAGTIFTPQARAIFVATITTRPSTEPYASRVHFADIDWNLPNGWEISPTTADDDPCPIFTLTTKDNYGGVYNVVYNRQIGPFEHGSYPYLDEIYPDRSALLRPFRSDEEFYLSAMSVTQNDVARTWGDDHKLAIALFRVQSVGGDGAGIFYDDGSVSALIRKFRERTFVTLFDAKGKERGYLSMSPKIPIPDEAKYRCAVQLVSGVTFVDK